MQEQTNNTSKLYNDNKSSFLESINTFVFDCDGVLWAGNSVIQGAVEALAYLRSLGKKIRFVTNNSTKSRAQLDEVIGSSYGAAYYLKKINFTRKVYVIGEYGIEKEFTDAGIQYTKEFNQSSGSGFDGFKNLDVDPTIGAVVVGMDTSLSYAKCVYAHLCLTGKNSDNLFIATNPDTTFPMDRGITIPGAGSIVSMIKTCTNRKPIMIGKPENLLLDIIVERDSLDRSQVCMVGDRLDTDIDFGLKGNIKTLLVLTGITTQSDIDNNIFGQSNIHPHYYTNSIADLLN
eukprot:gene10034-12303_t